VEAGLLDVQGDFVVEVLLLDCGVLLGDAPDLLGVFLEVLEPVEHLLFLAADLLLFLGGFFLGLHLEGLELGAGLLGFDLELLGLFLDLLGLALVCANLLPDLLQRLLKIRFNLDPLGLFLHLRILHSFLNLRNGPLDILNSPRVLLLLFHGLNPLLNNYITH
jgi:hypothetical protein